MAADGGFGFEFDFDFDQGGGNPPGGGFSRLLLSDDVVSPFSFPVSPPPPPPSSCPSLFSLDTPKMLCFGDFSEEDELGSSQITSQSVPSSPVSKSSSNASISSLSNPSTCNKKRNGTPPPEKEASGDLSGAGAPKKSRSGPGHAKVKKREKLGDRIATLQQLVSPYGKTDTASVLHETMGYIRFLQDQVKVLCSPYLQGLPSSSSLLTSHGKIYKYHNSTQDLKSKGLCLIPVSSIADVASRNGADLWSPVTIKAIATRNAAASVAATTASLIC